MAIHLAGVDMSYTPYRRERIRRARKATLVLLWILDEFEEKG